MAAIPQDADEARLLELCRQGCPESQTLDIKRTLPTASDQDKRELLKDVCAMANADGGEIAYGIDEQSGVASSLAPITGESADAAKRRLGQVLDAGLEPRIPSLEFQDIPVTGGYVLVARVPASFDGPHCYKVNEARRFVVRNGVYIQDMTYSQLRGAFDRTATLTERAREFREHRLALIRDRKTWRPIIAGPVCAVHLIPIAAMTGQRSIDIGALYNNYTQYMFSFFGGASRSTNLDGLVVHPGLGADQKEIGAYTLIFRTGPFEAARYGGGFADRSKKLIPSNTTASFIRDAVEKFLKGARENGFSGPAIVGAALLTIGEFEFTRPAEHFDSNVRADRAEIVIPEIWVDALESASVDETVRPILDMLWQAFDVERCYLFGDDGKWKAPR